MVTKLEKVYEGKAKILYKTDDPGQLIQFFKDDATAFDGKKKGIIEEKGVFNNKISSHIFTMLETEGINTHYVSTLSDREMLVKNVKIVPVEVVIRNTVAGSLAKRMGMEEGTALNEPIIEYYYKSDELGDPMINRFHIRVFNLASDAEMDAIEGIAKKVNNILVKFFDSKGIKLIDYKLEFGRSGDKILLADEITPDGCRLWDKKTNKKLDKDRFRRDLGDIEDAYSEVYERVCS